MSLEPPVEIRKVLAAVDRVVFAPAPRDRGKTQRARWWALKLLTGEEKRSLRECAAEAGCSRTYLSRVAKLVAKERNLYAPWQRPSRWSSGQAS